MTRRLTAGAELKSVPATPTTGLFALDGCSLGTTAVVIETSVVRSGTASYKCVGGTTATSYVWFGPPTSSPTTPTYARAWIRITAYPTGTIRISGIGTFDAIGGVAQTYATLRMTASGNLQLLNQPGTQIGSNSAALQLDTWHLIEHKIFNGGTGAVDTLELYLDGELVGSITTDSSVNANYIQFFVGWIDAPGQAATMYIDDVAVNDGSGSYERAYPPRNGRVIKPLPGRVITNTGSWHTNKSLSATSADILDAIDNFPPIGKIDATADATNNQVRNASSTGTAELVIEFQSLGRAGIPGNILLDTLSASTYLALGSSSANQRRSERFYMAGTMGAPAAWIRTQGTPTDDGIVEVFADSGGNPTGSALATVQLPAASFSSGGGWVDFASLAYAVTTGTPYHAVLRRSGAIDAANYYEIRSATDTYADGGSNVYNGSAWGTIDTAVHLALRLYNALGHATINNIYASCCHAEAITTGTKTGALSMTQPVIAAATFNYGNDGGASASYPGASWIWATTALESNPAITSMTYAPRAKITKTDTTTRAALVCALFVGVEYTSPSSGLAAYTSGGTTYWLKQAPHTMTMMKADESEVTARSGQWFRAPDPLPDDGAFSTLDVIEDSDRQANYVPA